MLEQQLVVPVPDCLHPCRGVCQRSVQICLGGVPVEAQLQAPLDPRVQRVVKGIKDLQVGTAACARLAHPISWSFGKKWHGEAHLEEQVPGWQG